MNDAETIDPEIAAMMEHCESTLRAAGRVRPEPPRRRRGREEARCTPDHLRGCPREPDFPAENAQIFGPDTSHPIPAASIVGTTEVEFRAAADPASQNGVILGILREHFGQWLSIAELEKLSGSRRMNSRAADIRKLVDGEGLDVDQQSRPFPGTGRVHSYYRLIEKHASERRKRLAAAQEQVENEL